MKPPVFNHKQYTDLEADYMILKAENEQLKARLDMAITDLYKACRHSPCNNGICVKKNCAGNHVPCEFEWRGAKGGAE